MSATSRCWNGWSVPSAAPKLAEARADPAGGVLRELVDGAVPRLRQAADALAADSADEEWDDAWQEMGRLQLGARRGRPGAARGGRPRPQQRLAAAAAAGPGARRPTSGGAALLMVAELTPELAFLAGRDFERETDKARRTRRQFVREWAKIAKKLAA